MIVYEVPTFTIGVNGPLKDIAVMERLISRDVWHYCILRHYNVQGKGTASEDGIYYMRKGKRFLRRSKAMRYYYNIIRREDPEPWETMIL